MKLTAADRKTLELASDIMDAQLYLMQPARGHSQMPSYLSLRTTLWGTAVLLSFLIATSLIGASLG
jgi:hypothetical protein